MNYQKIYDQLIARAKTRKLEGYKERHHIVPKCLGGTNDSENLVDLTAREHFIAHLLLCEIYPDNQKLAHASWMMVNRKSKTQQRTYKISSRIYESIKLNLKHTDETKEKFKQRIISSETRDKIRNTLKQKGTIPPLQKGRTHTTETKKRLSEINKGKIITPDQIKKSRQTKLEKYGDPTWNGKPKPNRTPEEQSELIKQKRRDYYQQNKERILQNVKDRYDKNKKMKNLGFD
jgi:hypothetical protein